ncbi:hypothetical protein HMPREF9069_00380 [Atopobium sp. oral taxon 810 str. F0209]|nr:hypothetical protein HMPREF9069_00380 [Atopobium sp. oral taxon 810 str. F0209]
MPHLCRDIFRASQRNIRRICAGNAHIHSNAIRLTAICKRSRAQH